MTFRGQQEPVPQEAYGLYAGAILIS